MVSAIQPVYTEAISIEKLIRESEKDSTIKKLKKALEKGKIDKKDQELSPYKNLDQLTITESGLVMKKEKIILPSSLVKLALTKAHQGGHPGMNAMKRRIRAHFYYPHLNEEIEKFVKGCKMCAMFNPITRKNKLHTQSVAGLNAWEKISIDLFGPMPDNHHILVAQDMVSKFPAAKIMGKTDTKAVTNALDEIYNAYGDPLVHRSDNGPPFNSAGFKQFSDDRGIHHEKAFAYHPQANPVEGFMKPLGKAMKIAHRNNLNKSKALD